MEEYLVTANKQDINWWENFHIKGLKITAVQENKTIITASKAALAEIKLKFPKLKFDEVMI